MSVRRGEVVIVSWPLFRPSGGKAKARPALIVQNDQNNARMTNTILAMITSVTRRAQEPTQVLIELSTPDGQQTGLRQDSVVNCANLLTVEQHRILHTIGTFSALLVQQVNACLKAARELP